MHVMEKREKLYEIKSITLCTHSKNDVMGNRPLLKLTEKLKLDRIGCLVARGTYSLTSTLLHCPFLLKWTRYPVLFMFNSSLRLGSAVSVSMCMCGLHGAAQRMASRSGRVYMP